MTRTGVGCNNLIVFTTMTGCTQAIAHTVCIRDAYIRPISPEGIMSKHQGNSDSSPWILMHVIYGIYLSNTSYTCVYIGDIILTITHSNHSSCPLFLWCMLHL